jgi:hypothetical protein
MILVLVVPEKNIKNATGPNLIDYFDDKNMINDRD